MKQAYPIILTPAERGYVVSVPDLDINTEGETIADAISMAEDAIGMWGLAARDLNKPTPAPSSSLPKCEKDEIATFAVVDFEAYRHAYDMRYIRKNVTVPSYLNDLAERAGINFSQILQEGLKARLGVQ